jgi:flagellin-like hook-associated protein FlgL
MEADVALGFATRNNLLSLKRAKSLSDTTARRLASGLKVETVSDDPVAYFLAKSLSDRASDYLTLKDGIDQSIGTLSAMMNGTSAIESVARQMKGLVMSAASQTEAQRASLASQFDDLRRQITQQASDTTYSGNALISGGTTLTVELAPGGTATTAIPSKDLRVSGGRVDDVKVAWLDDADNDGTADRLGSRDFSTELSATSDESLASSGVGSGSEPRIARLTGGNTVIGVNNGTTDSKIFITDSSGATVKEIPVSPSDYRVAVTGLNNGRIAATWIDKDTACPTYAVYEADGSEVQPPTKVIDAPLFLHQYPAITADAAGGFTVTWNTTVFSGAADDIAVARFDSAGTVLGATMANDVDVAVQVRPVAAGLTDGTTILAWEDGNTTFVRGKAMNADGTLGAELQLSDGVYPCVDVQLAALTDGGFAATWTAIAGSSEAHIRVFNADGTPRTGEINIDTSAQHSNAAYPSITALTSGGFAVAWRTDNADTLSTDVFMASFTKSGTVSAAATQITQSTTLQSIPVVASANLNDLAYAESGVPGDLHLRSAGGYSNFATAADRAAALKDLDKAIETVRAATGYFTNQMVLLKTRLDFNGAYAETQKAGAAKLTQADLNEEAANTLALQVRQQLAMQGLSFATQSDQSIMTLFR